VVLQRYFDAEEALKLMEQEKVSFINGRPHQWVRLKGAANWASADLSSLKYVPRGDMIWEHPTVSTDWEVPNAFGTTETFTVCTGFTADTSKEYYNGSFGGRTRATCSRSLTSTLARFCRWALPANSASRGRH